MQIEPTPRADAGDFALPVLFGRLLQRFHLAPHASFTITISMHQSFDGLRASFDKLTMTIWKFAVMSCVVVVPLNRRGMMS